MPSGKLCIFDAIARNTNIAFYSLEWADTGPGTRGNTEWDAGITVQIPLLEGSQREIDLRNATLHIVK